MLKKLKEFIEATELYKTQTAVIITSVLLCCFLSFASEQAVVATNVVCGDESETVVSFSRDPDVIVSKSSFGIVENDELDLENFDAENGNGTIVIEREKKYSSDFMKIAALTISDSVSEAIELADERIESERNVKPFHVKIIDSGKVRRLKVTGGTVEEALVTAGIKLGEDDKVSVPLSASLKKGLEIRIKRIVFKDVVKTVAVDYKTKVQYDPDMYKGESYVKRAGARGEKTEYYIEKTVDSVVKEEMLVGSTVTRKPINEILICGSKERIIPYGSTNSTVNSISELPAKIDIELDENGRPKHYKQRLVGSATAYYGGYATATGEKPMPGRVAVDPREIPYHSKLYIVSCDGNYLYGYSEASDTGGFIYNSNTLVDLYFHTYEECVQFGRRDVEVYVLE